MAASLSWLAWEYVKTGKCTLGGMVTGTLAGLAAITPASGYVGPGYAIMMGAIAGMMCQGVAYFLRHKLKVDDSLDVFAVPGAGGIYGSLMIAPLGQTSWGAQLGGIGIITTYCDCSDVDPDLFCKGVMGIRTSPGLESGGADQTLQGERASGVIETPERA